MLTQCPVLLRDSQAKCGNCVFTQSCRVTVSTLCVQCVLIEKYYISQCVPIGHIHTRNRVQGCKKI